MYLHVCATVDTYINAVQNRLNAAIPANTTHQATEFRGSQWIHKVRPQITATQQLSRLSYKRPDRTKHLCHSN